MSSIFLRLLNMSLAAGWLIIAVTVLRMAARNAPRWGICLLWGVVAIRLICPFPIECPFSLVPSYEIIPEDILSEACRKLDIATGVQPVDTLVNGYLGDTYYEGVSVAFDYGNIFMSKAGVLWLCGVFGVLLYGGTAYLRLRRRLKESVLYRERIYRCDHVRSPFVFGFLRPCIYLPSGMDASDTEYVIRHERAHIQRKDHIWKGISFLLLAIYWFNPLSWIAFMLFCRDIELACDEKVIRNLSMVEKKEYSKSLLSCSFRKRIAIVHLLTFGEVGVKRRVKFILNYKKPGFLAVFFSILACIVVAICFMTTLPQEHQSIKIIPATSSERIQLRRREYELEQVLLDYDKDNILKVYVTLEDYDTETLFANIFVDCKDEITDTDERAQITNFVSEYLDLDTCQINIMYGELYR